MPREVTKDKCGEHVEAASRRAKLTAGGTAGNVINPVHYTPGKSELYQNRGKKNGK